MLKNKVSPFPYVDHGGKGIALWRRVLDAACKVERRGGDGGADRRKYVEGNAVALVGIEPAAKAVT